MKLAFITGITGQDGSYLAELLLEKNYKVFGIQRRTSLFNTSRIDHIRNKLTMRYGDMTDGSGLSHYIHTIIQDNEGFEVFEIYNLAAQSHVKISFEIPEYTSDVDGLGVMSDGSGLSRYIHTIIQNNEGFEVFEIYNLAAQSHVKISFEIPEYTSDVDGMGVMRLLEIIRTLPQDVRLKVKFYQAGTSELYGRNTKTPQNELTEFCPVSPYACAKLYAYHMVKTYRQGYGLFLVNGILFNHESPRRGENFVTMKIVNGIKRILSPNAIINNEKTYIELGNLYSKRDWGHAKDYVRGMWQMLQQVLPSDYVLATGKTYTVKDFVNKAFEYKGVKLFWYGEKEKEVATDKNGVIRVKINPKYYRPNEVDLLLGDPTKAKSELGWTPEFDTLDKLIKDMFQ